MQTNFLSKDEAIIFMNISSGNNNSYYNTTTTNNNKATLITIIYNCSNKRNTITIKTTQLRD